MSLPSEVPPSASSSVSGEELVVSVLSEDIAFAALANTCKELGWDEQLRHRLEAGFTFARKAHEGQKRKNGENYIVHPVEVAHILAKMRVDPDTVMAALLHDVLEDTPCTPEAMEKAFGKSVLSLVQGVTKLGRVKFSSKEEQQAENCRRMLLAMAQDVRVITLKLADRLHNMRTLYFLAAEKQKKIANETIDIFAPLANRMGMGNIRAELEDLSLKYLEPESYQQIEEELANTRKEREDTMQEIIDRSSQQMEQSGIQFRIYGRLKNYYSIYSKMASHKKQLSEIFDISALRIIVDSEPLCYEVLGLIHHGFTPVAGRFKDYIAMPKSNFYQSLHTTVIGPKGRPVEVQIRTQRMHEIAEYGLAAHFKYKESGGSVTVLKQDDKKLAWLKQMSELRHEAGTAQEFIDSVKLDLFPDQVFVFTPKGEVVSLPKGSTPVDFAFRIHTEVGNRCAGSIVNDRIVTLDSELNNGDMVEILTNKKASPRLDWVNFVRTQHAKTRIRQWYKKHFREQHEHQGRSLLEAELTRSEVDTLLKQNKLLPIAKELNYLAQDDLLVAIGYGELPVARVISRLKRHRLAAEQAALLGQELAKGGMKPEEPLPQQKNRTQASGLALGQVQQGKASPHAEQRTFTKKQNQTVTGLKGLLYHIARCCMPVPGDAIAGIVTRSRGVMVHREDCINIAQANPARLMSLSWDGPVEMQRKAHSVCLEVTALDKIGLYRDVLDVIAKENINLCFSRSKPTDENKIVTIEATVDVKNADQLESLILAIRQMEEVLGVKRRPYRPNK
jgi:GTP diphosphokinase / guanosine-3',5'-bis(diphosphate) 3'-diphosphatase